MRFGFTPIRGSNPRASAPDQGLCAAAQSPWFTSVITRTSVWLSLGTLRSDLALAGHERGQSLGRVVEQLLENLGVGVHGERDRGVPQVL